MAELTNAEKLAEARTALHSLLTGKRIDAVSYRDRRLGFAASDIAELRKYIAELEGLVDPTRARKPFRIIW